MTTTKPADQPEALRIADAINGAWLENADPEKVDVAMIQAELRRLHAENERLAALAGAQQPATHVQNPAEIEHVAGDVSKTGAESNMSTQQSAPATQQAHQQPCPTCAALARTVMLDQVSFDRKPDCYGIRQITDDEGVEEWEDIRTSPDVAREEANDMMATGRGEIYEVVPLWTTPQPAPATQQAVGNSGFDYKTAADFLGGKTVSDEAVRKFVSASRWAHDDCVGLRATLLSVRGELASREAEIALLKKTLMDAEAAPTPQADSQPAPSIDDLCARIKAADDAAADRGYMLDSNDCIAVLRGHWKGPMAMDKPDRAARAPADSVLEDAEPAPDMSVMQLAESVGLIGPASRVGDLHAAIQRFHDLICVNATIKAAVMAADAIKDVCKAIDIERADREKGGTA